MSQERFTVLMRQFIEDQINEQGMAELGALLASGDHDEDLKMIYDEVYDAPSQSQDLSPDHVQKILYAVYNSEAGKPAIIHPFHQRARIGQRTRIGWAAAILLLLAGGGYLMLNRHSNTAASGNTAVRPSLPGHSDKAVLTLANGQQITLDNAAQGSLAQQNGVTIVKTDSGQLTYVAEGGGAAGRGAAAGSQYNTLSTPRGGQYQVVLPDGTKAWLNSASSLKYPTVFDGKTRNVELRGEAYFEVAKNSRSPFTVNTSDMQVVVLGTAFNLMAYADEGAVRTTLVNGVVRLLSHKGAQMIKPGEQGSLDKREEQFTVSRPDLDEVLAWKDGEFKFSGQTIQTIMRQMVRWYDVDIEYQGVPPDIRFNGDISSKQNASALLDILETTRAVHFKIEGRKIIVIPGPVDQQNQ